MISLHEVISEIMSASSFSVPSLYQSLTAQGARIDIRKARRFKGCTFYLSITCEGKPEEMMIPFVWKPDFFPSMVESFRMIRTLNQGIK